MTTADENAPEANEPEVVAPKKSPSVRPGGARSLIGAVLGGRYKIVRILGEGGMGAVYAAEHTLMRKRVAVKVLHPDMNRRPEAVSRFEREAQAVAQIDHANVATATDFGKLDDGSFFLVLEYVEGKNLRVALEQGSFDVPRALHITRQIAAALVRAHGLGIVHRDLKPENVMLVERSGDPDFVKVLDFGIAKVADTELEEAASARGEKVEVLTQLGMVYGTPDYMAPEQALGEKVDARADLYALGVMTYEMITGTRPFIADTPIALLSLQVNAPVPPMSERTPHVPPEIEALVQRLLAKDPRLRVQDAKELLARLPQPLSPDLSGAVTAIQNAPSSIMRALLYGQLHGGRALKRTMNRLQLVSKSSLRIAGGAVALVLFTITATLAVTHQRDLAKAETADSASASASAPPPLDDRIRQGESLLEQRNYARAIDILTQLSDENLKRPEVRHALASAYAGAQKHEECMITLRSWLKEDPTIASDLDVRIMVRDAAISEDAVASDLAFMLLEKQMGPSGLDDLYDVAYGVSGQHNPSARDRARKELKKPELRAFMSAALLITLDVAAVGGSCRVKDLFPRAQSDGDARTAALLKPLSARIPTGWFGSGDALQCIHDGSLSKTLAAIDARTK